MRLSPWQKLAGVLLAAVAITYGCSADDAASVLPATTGTTSTSGSSAIGSTNLDTSGTPSTPIALNSSALRTGRGSEDDLVTANRLADLVFASLAGGGLDAADGQGGPIDDPDFATAGLGSSANALNSGTGNGNGAWLLPVALSALGADLGARQVFVEPTGLRVSSDAGLDVKLTGVTALTSTYTVTASAAPVTLVDGYRLGSTVRVLGTLGVGQRPEIDLRFQGITGVLGRDGLGANAIDLTIVAPGVTIQGLVMGMRVDATITGIHGRFTDLSKLNAKLSTQALQLHVQSLVARGEVTALRGEGVLSDVQLPTREGGTLKFLVSGNLDATLDSKHPLARTGRVSKLKVDVLRTAALRFDGSDGPLDGSAAVELSNSSGSIKDKLSYAYRNGTLTVTGSRTNVSGDQERISSSFDSRRSAGNVKFTDGSRTEHVVDVRRTARGRRIKVTFLAKDPRGVQQVAGDSTVHADRGLTGTWVRPAPGGSNGTFTVASDGELELIGPQGDLRARATVRDGWSELLY